MFYRFGAGIVLAVFLPVLLAGCSGSQALRLDSHDISFDGPVEAPEKADAHFLLLPFEDERGPEFGYVYPSTFIPIASLFHMGGYTGYPENAGILKGRQDDQWVVSVGTLDQAMPYLLATLMEQMKLSTNSVPLDSFEVEVAPEPFDYLVKGRLIKTRYNEHVNIVPLGILGLLGAPYRFSDYEMEFEVSVFAAADLASPVLKKTYSFSDEKVGGAYYNHHAAWKMFMAGLENTLPQVIRDVAAAL